ncbi:MAG: hypothetical protein Q9190_007997, partial [Brigantiaea leucoxantha]
MSLQRCVRSLPSNNSSASKFAASAASSTLTRTYLSPHPQSFHSTTHIRPNSKRKLVTSSTFRPHSFDSGLPPAPPRNTGIPDSSIAGSPQINETRPPLAPEEHSLPFPSRQDSRQKVSLPESEAQKSKPVTTPNPVSSVAPTPQKKSKLRPRKAAMTVTPSATTHLRELLSQPEPKLIRVGVKNRGCSGLAYNLEYVDKPGMFDEEVEQDGVKVLIDSKALFSIIGSEMDWVEDKLNRRFVFRNPNI